MKRLSVFQLAFLSLCSVLITESESSFVPGRCQCPETQLGVRGQLKNVTVHQKSPSCDKITVIVTLKADNSQVCLNPDAAMGAQLIRCWNRAQKMGRNVKVCLRRRKKARGGKQQRSRQRSRSHSRKALTH